jgi:hypothetical protein
MHRTQILLPADLHERAAQQPESPGITELPPEWSLLPLSAKTRATPAQKPLILKPGEALDLESEPWRPEGAAEFLVQATYAVYEGPAAYQGLPVVKGRLFSEPNEIRPKGR